MILRSTIVKLLQHRVGLFSPDVNGDIPPAKSHIPTTQQVRTAPLMQLDMALNGLPAVTQIACAGSAFA